MIYLASPYSHRDARVREARFDAACRAAANGSCTGQARVFAGSAQSSVGAVMAADGLEVLGAL